MKIFLLDLWHDLKEKRLWPVAAVLLVALVAVPVLLAKPAEETPAPAPVAKASGPKANVLQQLAKVKLGDDEVGDGSTLGAFDPSNPFNPPKGAIKKDQAETTTAGPSGTDGGSSAPAGDGGPPDTPGNGNPGGINGGGNSGGGDTGGGDTPSTTTTVYKYVVDLTYTANGHSRRIKGMEKLDMLPNQSAPLLIFMGVTPKGSNAVFLVDSTLKAAGEGRCKPSASKCAFAYIGAGSEYIFTEEDGDSYTVRIDEIRKVKVGAGGTAAKARGAKARAAVGPDRRFVLPLLADEVVVQASETTQTSDTDTESR